MKRLADDPQHAFPGQGQMKPEQLVIAQLTREVAKLKAERDILKKARPAPGDLARGVVVRGARCLARWIPGLADTLSRVSHIAGTVEACRSYSAYLIARAGFYGASRQRDPDAFSSDRSVFRGPASTIILPQTSVVTLPQSDRRTGLRLA